MKSSAKIATEKYFFPFLFTFSSDEIIPHRDFLAKVSKVSLKALNPEY